MIHATLRALRAGKWRLAIILIVAAGTTNSPLASVAQEQVLVNVFNPNRGLRDFRNSFFDLAVDTAGRLYIERHGESSADFELHRFNPDGTYGLTLVSAGHYRIQGVGVEQDGHPAYIADDFSLVRIPGLDEFPLPFTEPGDNADELEVDGDGNLYVTTSRTNSILILGPSGQHLDTIDVPLPDRSAITAMEVGLAGEIFIATTASNQVGRVIDLAGLTVFDPFNWQGPSQISAVTFNSVTNEVLAVTRDSLNSSQLFRLDAANGTLLGMTPIEGAVNDVEVDQFGSMYATIVDNADPPELTPYILAIDPTITASQLDEAARVIVLPGKSFDDSPEGAYFRGLAARAARTRNNLYSVSEARWLLDELRQRANSDVDPQQSDPMSLAIEQINGFLAAIESNSPLIAGEGPVRPGPLIGPPFSITASFIAEEPFYGHYRAGQPITFPPPAHVELTLDPATATSNFIKPAIWGRGDPVRPAVISSRISLDFNGLLPTVNEFSMVLGSFDINGAPSGINRGRLSPNRQLHMQFGRQGRDFEGHVEGWITNDLYPDSRPIFAFLDLQGFIPSASPNDDVTVYGTNEPLIVPGLPGQPPTTMAGIGFVATRAEFNQTANTLVFHENTDPSKTPDLSVILTPDGVFAHSVGAGEPAVGAGLVLPPLLFTGLNPVSGRYEFANAALTLLGDTGPFATALLTDIGIDPRTLNFTATVGLVQPLRSDSPFVNALARGPADILLLTPSGTLDLLTLTDNFTRSGISNTDFTILSVVPEPGSLALCAIATLAIAAMALVRIARFRAAK